MGDVEGAEDEARHHQGVEHRLSHRSTDEDREAREANAQRRGGQLQVGDVEGAEEEARHLEGGVAQDADEIPRVLHIHIQRGEIDAEGAQALAPC